MLDSETGLMEGLRERTRRRTRGFQCGGLSDEGTNETGGRTGAEQVENVGRGRARASLRATGMTQTSRPLSTINYMVPRNGDIFFGLRTIVL